MAETLLTVKHLVKQYGDHIVLNDISLDIKKGEVMLWWGRVVAERVHCFDASMH